MRLFIRVQNELIKKALETGNPIIPVCADLYSELYKWIAVGSTPRKARWLETGVVHLKKEIFREEDLKNRLLVYTDASGGAGGLCIENLGEKEPFYWPKGFESEDIFMKEAYAIYIMLKRKGSRLKDRRILIKCDNQVVCSALYHGSRVGRLNSLIHRIYEVADEWNIDVRVDYVNTKEQLADEPSRTFDFNESEITDEAFKECCSYWGETPTIDAFATKENARAERYISRYSDDQAVARDFFRFTRWRAKEVIYAFPPRKLATLVFSMSSLDVDNDLDSNLTVMAPVALRKKEKGKDTSFAAIREKFDLSSSKQAVDKRTALRVIAENLGHPILGPLLKERKRTQNELKQMVPILDHLKLKAQEARTLQLLYNTALMNKETGATPKGQAGIDEERFLNSHSKEKINKEVQTTKTESDSYEAVKLSLEDRVKALDKEVQEKAERLKIKTACREGDTYYLIQRRTTGLKMTVHRNLEEVGQEFYQKFASVKALVNLDKNDVAPIISELLRVTPLELVDDRLIIMKIQEKLNDETLSRLDFSRLCYSLFTQECQDEFDKNFHQLADNENNLRKFQLPLDSVLREDEEYRTHTHADQKRVKSVTERLRFNKATAEEKRWLINYKKTQANNEAELKKATQNGNQRNRGGRSQQKKGQQGGGNSNNNKGNQNGGNQNQNPNKRPNPNNKGQGGNANNQNQNNQFKKQKQNEPRGPPKQEPKKEP
ncbi:Oidioi.mRNA.OKI2018_I69.chr1.g2252.t1.cds [Oikopleura dioica]|uniref:Oidioi.mRNA.OKI2018_I69.chr1.g2252.t1.cds n=1 Tax=Oikopleura dioica TaxID=34765 RepID=A0ABN7SQJ4_OIKDI|nr:Oidioi.mRNA.OKI2018_I69.chr1.g2252.t1.cds [Oikopleura dioica]